jgi:hypothetical protein
VRRTPPAYLAAETVTGLVGVFLELRNPAGTARLRVRQIRVTATTAATITARRTTGTTAGGTSSAGTVTKLDTTAPAATPSTLVFTAAPTVGTGPTTLRSAWCSAGSTLEWDTTDLDWIIPPGSNLELAQSVNSVINVWVLWTEEPV